MYKWYTYRNVLSLTLQYKQSNRFFTVRGKGNKKNIILIQIRLQLPMKNLHFINYHQITEV